MVELFTKSIVREIGRNVGKAASNQLLGNSHSTPYRRVNSAKSGSSKSVVLGASSGGYKYENQLDRLIRTFQIKGKLATFNSAQNIYNEYFKLVEEANTDNNISSSEALYLVEQYYRVINKLDKISQALLELNSKDKSQIVVEKIMSMNEFMIELDNNFETSPLNKKEINNKFSKRRNIFALITVLIIFFLVAVFISKELYLSSNLKLIFFFLLIFSFLVSYASSSSYKKHKLQVLKHNSNIDLIKEIKELISKAINSITITKVDNTEDSSPKQVLKKPDPLNLNYYRNNNS